MTLRVVIICGLLAASTVQAAPPLHSDPGATPEILITSFRAKQWQVRYDFDAPVARIVFPRSPDDSRAQAWIPDQAFEIIATPAGEVAQRKDGAMFRTARFRMSPLYRHLPSDYAPFSPFGDGGMLFHTGRFFACAERCPEGAASESASWSMTLWAAPEDRIIINGAQRWGQARWIDRDSGRVVYVGSHVPRQTPDVVALLDEALPTAIRNQLEMQLPAFMHLFSKKLGAVASRPMLFVSYDVSSYSPSHPDRWGSQGGTLPGQVFIHFYGSRWPTQITKPGFADDLSWHFAHEAAHIYQRQGVSKDKADYWIHEGAAEALAAIAMRSQDANAAPFLQSRMEAAKKKCREQLNGRSIRDALAQGSDEAAYSCGILVNLRIDSDVRRLTRHDGLYAVWQEYLLHLERQSTAGEDAYVASIAEVGGAELADWVHRTVRARDPEFRVRTPAEPQE